MKDKSSETELPDLEDNLLPPIPSSWCWATPRELASQDGNALAIGPFGSNLKVSDYQSDGVPLVFVRNIRSTTFGGSSTRFVSASKACELAAHSVDAGDILVTKMGDPPGDACAYPEGEPRAIITADCIKFRLHIRLGVPRFFVHAINSLIGRRQIALITKGVAQQKVSLGRFVQLRLPVPPLNEQCRIVAKIEELYSDLDAGVEALERIRANLKRYRAAILKAAVEGKLTEEWRAEHPKTEPASKLLERILAGRRRKWEEDQLSMFAAADKTPPKGWQKRYVESYVSDASGLPELPQGWCWASVDQLASPLPRSIQSGPFGSNLLHSEFQDNGVLAIGIDNVLDGAFSLGRQHRISASKFSDLIKYEARPLDVLITVMATVGRCCVVPEDCEPAIITKHVYRVTSDQQLVNSYFLQLCFSGGSEVRNQIRGNVRGQTRPGINGVILRAVAIPLPHLAEQQQIIAEVEQRLSIIGAAQAQVDANLKRASRLRQSILERAFEGRLVPQDPTDEPADKLLDRIRQERAGSNCSMAQRNRRGGVSRRQEATSP